MTLLEQNQIKAQNALDSINDHPALRENFFENLQFSIQKVCKKGYCEFCKKSMQITKSEYKSIAKRFKLDEHKFDKEFEKELNDIRKDSKNEKRIGIEKEFITIYKPYKTVFGEEWKFDHVEFWAELSFQVFTGNVKEYFKPDNWCSYAGEHFAARSFEEMIIKGTKKFKQVYGNFNRSDFLTKEEKENHKKERLFKNKSMKNGYITMIPNPKYIHVNDGELNRRWLKWFSKTEYCKKNWKTEFTNLLK